MNVSVKTLCESIVNPFKMNRVKFNIITRAKIVYYYSIMVEFRKSNSGSVLRFFFFSFPFTSQSPVNATCIVIIIYLFVFFIGIDDLEKKLEDWIAPNPKIKLLRHKEREGLIRARLTGAKVATGQVLYIILCYSTNNRTKMCLWKNEF